MVKVDGNLAAVAEGVLQRLRIRFVALLRLTLGGGQAGRILWVVPLLVWSAQGVAQSLPAPGSSGSGPAAIPNSAQPPLQEERSPLEIVQPVKVQTPLTSVENTQAQAISQVRIVGNTAIPTNKLLEGVWPTAEDGVSHAQMLTLVQMQAIANRVTDRYRADGYLAAVAYLPAQDITAGVLTIGVLEGRLDRIEVNAETPESAQRVKEVLQAHVPADRPLEQGDLERGVILSGELANQTVTAQLQPGSQTGSTSVLANATALPKYTGGLTVDNYGIPNTGQVRFTADLGIRSLIFEGDRVALELGTTNDPNLSRRYDASYDVPVGLEGVSVGVRAWQSNYALGGLFNTLGALGVAQAQGVHVGYALFRGNANSADWRVGYNWIDLNDEMKTVAYFNPRRTQAAWTDLGGWFDDQWLGTSAHTTWMASETLGSLSLNNNAQRLADALGNSTQGQYALFTYGLAREQALGGGLSAYANGHGQQAAHNLDSYYKFSLGGPAAVRAYPIGEVMGDDATVLTGELRYTRALNVADLSGYTRVSLFYDWGRARINQFPTAVQSPSNTAVRAGYGVGLDAGLGSTVNGKVYWAKSSDSKGYSQSTGQSSLVGAQLTVGF